MFKNEAVDSSSAVRNLLLCKKPPSYRNNITTKKELQRNNYSLALLQMMVWLSRINKELASPTGDNKKEHTRKRALPDYPFTTHRLSLIELPPVFGALAHGNLVLSASSVRKRESEPWQWTVKIEFGLIIATVAIVGGNSSPIWGFRELWHCVLRQALLNLRMIQK